MNAYIILTTGIILIILALVIIEYTCQCSYKYKEYRAIVINLARRRERMIQFGNHFNLPMKYEIFDAVDGLNIDVNKLYADGILGVDGLNSIQNTMNGQPKRYHYELCTPGAIGCSLSHIQIWDKMIKEDIKYLFVFEDDAWVINVNMEDIIENMNKLPKDWHIYMIGQPHSILEGIPYDNQGNLHKITRFCGTHAYVINLEGAKWLKENGKLYPIQQQIDAHMSELAFKHGLNIYIHLMTPHIGPFSTSSDIQVNSNMASWDRYELK